MMKLIFDVWCVQAAGMSPLLLIADCGFITLGVAAAMAIRGFYLIHTT
jgi:hypothetical protein